MTKTLTKTPLLVVTPDTRHTPRTQGLPGVGWKLRQRLNEEGLNVCSDLWQLSLSYLQRGLGLGEKTGRALWEACRGIDKRPVQVS